MISPMTKPGTRIVCVDAQSAGQYAVGYKVSNLDLHGLSERGIYTVAEILSSGHTRSGFTVVLAEIKRSGVWRGFDLARFDYLALPDSITSLLDIAPIDASIQLEPV